MTLIGYWLRRPEPGIVFGILVAAWFVVMAVAVGEPWILMPAVLVIGVTVLVWLNRGLWRDNAEHARRGE